MRVHAISVHGILLRVKLVHHKSLQADPATQIWTNWAGIQCNSQETMTMCQTPERNRSRKSRYWDVESIEQTRTTINNPLLNHISCSLMKRTDSLDGWHTDSSDFVNLFVFVSVHHSKSQGHLLDISRDMSPHSSYTWKKHSAGRFFYKYSEPCLLGVDALPWLGVWISARAATPSLIGTTKQLNKKMSRYLSTWKQLKWKVIQVTGAVGLM